MEQDELTAGLKHMAAKMADELMAEAKATVPSGGGRLIRDDMVVKLTSQFAVTNPIWSRKLHEEWLARERSLSRWAKARRRVSRILETARWRLSKAWAHLRGIECPTDY